MKSRKNSLSLLLVVLALSSLLAGQQTAQSQAVVPRLVNYSGKAIDARGNVVAGTAGVTFAIYKDQYQGAPLWIETQNVNADAKGSFTAQLGATKSGGLPLDLFTSGEARWLGVRVNGGEEQPRLLLLSVPYALKAADAETIGGLPPSAFVLATQVNAASGTAPAAQSAIPSNSPPTITGTGTADYLPLWTSSAGTLGNSVLFQSGTGSTVKIGINTTVPSATLDVKGGATVRGPFTLVSTGIATSSKGTNSFAQNFTANSYNSSTNAGVPQNFRWQVEPVGNNTATPSGSLNLLFNQGSQTATETGLKIASNGQITFASGQAFPGTGTVSSVALSAPSSDFTVTNSPVTSNGTLALNWTVVPTNATTANAIVKRDALGSFSAGPITVVGNSLSPGLSATNAGGDGVSASSTVSGGAGVRATGPTGLYGVGSLNGVYGSGTFGVNGVGTTYGIWGSNSPTAVRGDGATYGVVGTSTNGGGAGVYGSNTAGIAVYGFSTSSGSYGVYGYNPNGGVGAAGISSTNAGVYAQSGPDGWAADAYNTSSGTGILAGSASGFAGWFNGNVEVDGNLSKAGGSFKIDHPLDPANKYLYHSFVESPDMMNIYNGNVTTDGRGDAVVKLPEWFETLNRDFRYQLTVIGQFAQAIVSREIADGRFTIKTDKPSVKVSWQVTGIRQDAWANAHRIPVEEQKPEVERGSYLHPELYGAPEEKGVLWAHSPEAMKQWKAARTAQNNKESMPKP